MRSIIKKDRSTVIVQQLCTWGAVFPKRSLQLICNLFVDAFEVKMAPGILIMVSLKQRYLGVGLQILF